MAYTSRYDIRTESDLAVNIRKATSIGASSFLPSFVLFFCFVLSYSAKLGILY